MNNIDYTNNPKIIMHVRDINRKHQSNGLILLTLYDPNHPDTVYLKGVTEKEHSMIWNRLMNMEELGIQMENIRIPFSKFIPLFQDESLCNMTTLIHEALQRSWKEFEDINRELNEPSNPVDILELDGEIFSVHELFKHEDDKQSSTTSLELNCDKTGCNECPVLDCYHRAHE
jgi:hypothetical protein